MFGIKKKAAAEPAATAPASTQESSTAGDYAGFWLRFLALIADMAILAFASSVIALLTSFAGEIGAMVAAVIIMLATLLYWVVMHSSQRQATFGKAMLGIIVTDNDGNRISMLHSLGRELAKLISMLPMGIGFLIAGFTGKKQALHDMIASTVVVRDGDAHIARTIVVTIVGYAMAFIGGSFVDSMDGELSKGAERPAAVSAKPAAPKAPVATPGAPATAPAAAPATPSANAAPAAAPVPAPGIEVPPDEPEVKAPPRRRTPRAPSAAAEGAAPKAPSADPVPMADARPAPAPKPCVYKPVMTDEEINACRPR